MYDFDLFVIGAGSGGVRASRFSAALGAKVAVAEDTYLGGTCVNVGCVPKKLFVYASEMRQSLKDMAGYGVHSKDEGFSWLTLRDNKTKEILRLNGIYKNLLTNSGVELIEGRATLTGLHEITVGVQTYTAKNILVATGGWPYVPDIPGKEHIITSNEVFYMDDFPKKALVVGGGYIAVEFAGIFNGLGCDTSILYRGDQVLRGFDQEIRDFTANEIRSSGVQINTNGHLLSVEKLKSGALEATIDIKGRVTKQQYDCILMSTGRKAKTENLGLDTVGVNLRDNGSIIADEHFRTNIEHIYAIGDVIDRVALTPVALAEGMYVADHLFAEVKPTPVDYKNIATAVFCQPNIGTLGLTEEDATANFDHVKVFTSEFKGMKNTLSGNIQRTLMKLIVCGASDQILGVHMAGPDAGEIIQGLAVAVKAGATKADFDRTIGIHPTAAEEFVTMRTLTREHIK